jgi:hypothetical protein
MKSFSLACGSAPKVLSITAFASLALGLSSFLVASAQQKTLPSNATPVPTATRQPSAEEAVKRKSWHATMRRTSVPKNRCFRATYPNTEWQEVSCTTVPDTPYPLVSGPPRPDIVGSGNDFVAQTSGLISSAQGSFVSVTGATSVSSPGGNSNFALQLNTNLFKSDYACTPPPPEIKSPTCQGWQQFIYSNSGLAFIQYWLLNYTASGAKCSTIGWNTFTPTPNCARHARVLHKQHGPGRRA